MKKCVKKIPKYNGGTGGVAASVYNAAQKGAPNILNTQASKDFIQTADNVDLTLNQLNPFQTEMNWAEMNNKLQTGSVLGAVGTAVNLASNSIGKEATWQGAASGALQGAAAGMQIGGPWGALIGGVAGAGLASIGTGGDVDMNTGEITMPSGIAGMFGHSKGYLRRKSNMVKNALASRTLTENLRTDYYNNTPGAGSINVLAAEGGIMRQPVDALVSKGELIYNPVTQKLSQVPGSKGKPNKADDVYAKLYEGDVVISNSPTMLMANGKTPAQNLMGMVDKYATGGTVKAREAIIKKVVNWQEANKTKPQEYARYKDGTKGVNKYGYNKLLELFKHWDKSKNDYTDEYKRWVANLTEQDVRDIESGKYGDMSTYFSKNKGLKLDVATAQRLMTDKKYGDWHKIGQSFVDKKIANKEPEPFSPQPIKMKIEGTTMYQDVHPGNYPIDYEVSPININLKKVPDPTLAEVSKRIRQKERKQNFNDALDNLTGLAPLAAAMIGDYDYETVIPRIARNHNIPVGYSINDILTDNQIANAINNYNVSQMGGGTGAYLVAANQSAANLMKANSLARIYQKNKQNELIAKNIAQLNDWERYANNQMLAADIATDQNQGMAQQMKDLAKKDALEFYYGKRNDDILTAMMKPMFEYGTPDEAYRRIYKRRIV